MRSAASLFCLTLLAGCFSPKYSNGDLRCDPASAHACPTGYHCAADNACWKNGADPIIKHQGDACAATDHCDTGHCVDGYCCDAACDGACQACDVTPGSCTSIAGAPHGSRACTGQASGLCAGACDGTAADCTYPPASTICGASCNGTCDGAGTCSAGAGGSCPNGYACGASGCLTSCTQPSDCQTNFNCVNGSCTRVPESNCLDGNDNNGDGLVDCADPTCINTQVVCLPNAAAAKLGYVSATACAPGFSPTHINQDLNVPTTCSGCGCTIAGHCSYTVYGDSSGAGCFGASSLLTSFTAVGTYATNQVTSYSVKIAGSAVIDSCTGAGSGTPLPAAFNTHDNFCAATISPTNSGCSGGSVCAAKPPTSGSVCAMVSGSTCPAPYQTTSATWYLDGAPIDNRACTCGSCGTQNAGSCPGNLEMQVYTTQACKADGSDCHYCETSCCAYGTQAQKNYYYSVYDNNFGGDHAVSSVKINRIETPGSTCTGAGTVSSGTATPDASLSTLVCCQ